MQDRPFDSGLQPERTLLAWQRTTLAMGLVGIVGARLTVPTLGGAAIVVGILVGGLSALAYFAAPWQYRRVHGSLTQNSTLRTDGVPVALVAGASLIIGMGAAAFLIVTTIG